MIMMPGVRLESSQASIFILNLHFECFEHPAGAHILLRAAKLMASILRESGGNGRRGERAPRPIAKRGRFVSTFVSGCIPRALMLFRLRVLILWITERMRSPPWPTWG